ncbi:APC family permease [Lactobacillus sp. Sy-1]|uniref:APC family permease n=1 Tax=Lactobacillus sp. Sy-1 TaxID=2109645 RepID=UPI001C5A8DB7|nr:APC family permease [Lactobacillus sp. Sy-1]MBW1605969.1 APC family permease [Lactobacillus sp. Sy-1]
MWRYLKRLIIGKPLKSTDEGGQSLNKFKGLALLSSDALSSVAYGTEQITAVLLTLSVAALVYQIWIAALVLVLLFAITLSYQQIIYAYPSGGGAYLVASENWGRTAGLVAGGSLLVDYMLTVAVSTTSGTEAIVSAIPGLYNYRVLISCLIVVFIMLLNLRGMRESASILTVPVYLFILMIFIMIIWGGYNILTGQITYHAASAVGAPVQGMTLLLFFKAFSSGSSSLTGVEAISNSVPNFKKPKEKMASHTLAIMAIILGVFFGGITLLSYYMGIQPNAHVTVLSQIGAGVFGHGGFMFYVLQLSTAMILAVAANTGFSAFPILAYNLARDKFLPHAYLDKGDRLGYSNGIISLAIGALILIIMFKGETNLLVPLYSIGVFIPFTLSQSGMIIHWRKHREGAWVFKATINFIGALISAILVFFLLVLHFVNVWPYFIVMPLLILLFYRINEHYRKVSTQLEVSHEAEAIPESFSGATVVVLISDVTTMTTNAIAYAKSISDDIIAMHVSFDSNPKREEKVGNDFKKAFPEIRFVNIHSSYRSIVNPTLRFCDVIAKRAEHEGNTTTVLVPQFVPKHHWQQILHNQSGLRLRAALNSRQNIIVSTYNYHLE